MNYTIPQNVADYIPCFSTSSVPKRNRTLAYEAEALGVLKDYRHWSKISNTEYENLKKQIKAAPHNDAISSIMSRLRRKMYG